MTTRLIFLFFLLNIGFGGVAAQTKVRIRVLDENDQPLKFIRLTLSGTNLPIETQSNGEYTLEFPPDKTELVFYPPDKFERISPPNGTILLPEDKTRTIEIWLARKNGDNRELETFTRVLSKKEEDKARLKIENEQLKSRLEKFELGHETSAPMRDSLATMRDSIVSILRQKTGNSAALTREIAELQEAVGLKQQLFYKKIAGELTVYGDRLKDLRDALPRVRDAFLDNQSMARFDRIIGAYNIARDSLLQNNLGHAEIVRALWGAAAYESLADAYKETLIDVHQQTVLPLNTTLVDQFRAVRAEEIRPAKARKKAESAANTAFEKLNVLVPILENHTQSALAKLAAGLH